MLDSCHDTKETIIGNDNKDRLYKSPNVYQSKNYFSYLITKTSRVTGNMETARLPILQTLT